MFDRVILTEDLADCRGRAICAKGEIVSPESIAEAAERAPMLPLRALGDTPLAADVEPLFADPVYRHLFQGDVVRDAVRAAIRSVRLPQPLFDELLALRDEASLIHAHAFATAAVAARMLLCVARGSPGVPEVAASALLHDLGMRHVPPRLLRKRERLSGDDATRLAAHPLLGAYHVAAVLGRHPAVTAAQVHHWRCGQGYPTLPRPPSRSMEVVSIASAFVALTEPRPFRSEAYDARGAADVLVAEAQEGLADLCTVRVLVHVLRGGHGDFRQIRFGRERTNSPPWAVRYAHVTAPARSLV